MIHVTACGSCGGEGVRTQPPYDLRYHDRPYRWRAKDLCDVCGGTGHVPAAELAIADHARAAVDDYRVNRMPWGQPI